MKSEYKDLAKNEIINLRKNGVEISENVHLPLFAFLGDTTHKVFDMNPKLLSYPIIIIECTFLLDDHIAGI
jgi:ribonuclease Z